MSTAVAKGKTAELAEWIESIPTKISSHYLLSPIPIQVLAPIGWVCTFYLAGILFIAFVYGFNPGEWFEDIARVFSIPAGYYLDLPKYASWPLGLFMVAAGLVGAHTILWPLAPKLEDRVKLGGSDTHVDADPVSDFAGIDRDAKPAKPEVPQYIQKLITRFVDIHTLQPVGVLRSVLVLLNSDFDSYRHLLRTRECERSLERLRKLPPDAFHHEHCQEVLQTKEYGEIYARLGIPLEKLAPTLLERIEGERTKTPPPQNIY